jgi:predicted negative regulator of RcsB-dependent stress response
MRRFFAFLVFVAIVILAVGFWRGWFVVNKPQIQSDEQKAKSALDKSAENFKHDVHKGAEKVEKQTSQ